jgi:hypothetical protein
MRSLAFVIAGALALAACGGAAQPSPTPARTTAAPTATPAPTPAAQVRFTTDLKPENEVPPIANEEKSGSGKAIVTFDLTRDTAGAVMSAKVKFEITLTGFPATTAITLAHIHEAAAGTNGGVKIGFKTDAANAITLTTGGTTLKDTTDITVTDAALLQKIIDTPAGFYVNVHSKTNPGGVVRGQLTKA